MNSSSQLNKCQQRKRRRRRCFRLQEILQKQSDTHTKRAAQINVHHDLIIKMVKNKTTTQLETRMKRTFLQILAVAIICSLSFPINCQQAPDVTPFSSVGADNVGAEARADSAGLLKPQANAYDQLINFISNYANQQSAFNNNNNNNNRRSPVLAPLNGIQAQQRAPAQQQVSSTPLNPFLGTQMNQQVNRQRMPPFVSSSPATPYLTLNRINNQLASNTNQQQANRNFNLQPLITIPLLNQQQNSQRQPALNSQPLGPPRGVQPITQQRPSLFLQAPQRISTTSIPPPPPILTSSTPNPNVRQSGGFAPSGPPPSAANNAMVVVQSPPNATGLNKSQLETSTTPEAESNVVSSTVDSKESSQQETSTTSQPNATSEPTAPNWNPLDAARNGSSLEKPPKVNNKLEPSPDIVTVPPGYNPDNPNNQPQNYDISVSAQMGGSGAQAKPVLVQTSSLSSSAEATEPLISVAPTAVTTIIWSPPPSSEPTSPPIQIQASTKQTSEFKTTQTAFSQASSPAPAPPLPPTKIRDNSLLNDEANPTEGSLNPGDSDGGVVYGKSQTRDSKPTPPKEIQASPVSVVGQANIESSVPAQGRPFIQPVQIDNQVRPYLSGARSSQQPAIVKSNHGQLPFKPSKQLNGNNTPPLNVNSGFTITAAGNQTMPAGDIQDYVANQPPLIVPSLAGNQLSSSFQVSGANHEPTISAQGGQDPANFELNQPDQASKQTSDNATSNKTNTTQAPPKIRRPTFKPKSAEPPIRIDSCIVGDDSSCDQSHNERCVTEYGISSCHCKPGFARLSQLRGYCSPVSSLQLSMKIDKLSDDRRLVYNYTLSNSNSEEYQYLEFETIQALASAFQQTNLAKQFMGAKVNKFFERANKVWANVSVNFELNNVTKSDKIQNLAAQELYKVVQVKHKPLGDSTIMFDGSKEAISRLSDLNECANRDLNDCSKNAICLNDFGGFQCQCLPGYEDKHQNEEKSKHGRVCMGCSASYCSNRGECSIIEGVKQCKCKPNYIGAKCNIDYDVVFVLAFGSIVGLVILVITCWCLYAFNRRWKREQQKMDAMSATSGLTFNYVNSSTNSLMSPARLVNGAIQRTTGAGHQAVGAIAVNYGQRFGAALAGTRGNQHFQNDQQAIIGSTSSGSSAASQPIVCNTFGNYQYEDASLLIAPASNNSSEQTSPSDNSFRANAHNTMLPGNAYTLSGHHHHHHHHHPNNHHHHQQQLLLHHQNNNKSHQQITQFHPERMHDYRTMNPTTMNCPTNQYDARWRTLQQDNKQSALVGYYLSPDMLIGQQQQQQQQLYASPQRELCIDTGGNNMNKMKRHQGRGNQAAGFQHTRSRSQGRSSMYIDPEYEQDRRI